MLSSNIALFPSEVDRKGVDAIPSRLGNFYNLTVLCENAKSILYNTILLP